jgi:hypothetical protein
MAGGRTKGRSHSFVLDFFVTFCIKTKSKANQQTILLTPSHIHKYFAVQPMPVYHLPVPVHYLIV